MTRQANSHGAQPALIVALAFALIWPVAGALVALSFPFAAFGETKPANSVVNVSDADNGKDIDLVPGQTLQVRLKTVAGTGYSWAVSGESAPLKLTKSFHQRNKSPKPGAPQTTVFQFSAGSAGMTTLTLVYRRPWEYNVPPAKTFHVKVNVR